MRLACYFLEGEGYIHMGASMREIPWPCIDNLKQVQVIVQFSKKLFQQVTNNADQYFEKNIRTCPPQDQHQKASKHLHFWVFVLIQCTVETKMREEIYHTENTIINACTIYTQVRTDWRENKSIFGCARSNKKKMYRILPILVFHLRYVC